MPRDRDRTKYLHETGKPNVRNPIIRLFALYLVSPFIQFVVNQFVNTFPSHSLITKVNFLVLVRLVSIFPTGKLRKKATK